jgi:hypothetical protein
MNKLTKLNNSMKNLIEEKISEHNTTKKTKTRILVWLDFGPYAYFNFGVISALSKLDKFEFIGIVTIKKDYVFFQNQKLIQFKKLLYYPDCYINKPSYDLEKLEKYEKQYNLNLWLDVFADRSFYKYWIDFHKFTKNEILSIIENSITFFVDILETFEPDLVLMQQPGENISNLLLYRIANKTGINTITPNLLYLHNKILISNNIDSREISNEFKKLKNITGTSSEIYDKNYLKTHSFVKSVNEILSFNYNTKNIFQKFRYYVKRMWTEPEPIYLNKGKTKLKMIKNRYKSYFKIKKRENFLDSNSIKSIEDKKFFYFPLQSEPEALVLIKSPFYSDVITLVENIAKSIPIDSVLYVKEHPVQKIKSWRPIDVYQKIIDMPNVKLIHPSVNSQELISKSQAVFCVSGATGFEALFHKKSVILFSNEYYDVHSMIYKVRTFAELPILIHHAMNNVKFDNDELNALIQASNNQSITIPYHTMLNDAITLSSIQKDGDVDLTIQNFQKYYNSYKDYFSLIATTINSKL